MPLNFRHLHRPATPEPVGSAGPVGHAAPVGTTGPGRARTLRSVGSVALVSVLAVTAPAQAYGSSPSPSTKPGATAKPAQGPGTPDKGTPGKGTPGKGTPGKGTPGKGTPLDLTKLAQKFRLSLAQLERGLRAAKQAGGPANFSAAVRAFATTTGVSPSDARAILTLVFDAPVDRKPGRPSRGGGNVFDGAGLALFAAQLGVSHDAAAKAAQALLALADVGHGIDPGSAGFLKIATDLGVTPQKLQQALTAVKLSKSADGTPGKPGAGSK